MSNTLHGQQIKLTLPRVFFEAVVQSINSLITPFTDKDFAKSAKGVKEALEKTLHHEKGEIVTYATTNVFLESFTDGLTMILYKEGLEIKNIEALKAFFWECDKQLFSTDDIMSMYVTLASAKEDARKQAFSTLYLAPWER